MKTFHEVADWVAYILDKQDEYAYRYIADAYDVVQSRRNIGLYFNLIRSVESNAPQRFLLVSKHGGHQLRFENETGLQKFPDFLLDRFCPTSRDMNAWHEQQATWHREDDDEWVKPEDMTGSLK